MARVVLFAAATLAVASPLAAQRLDLGGHGEPTLRGGTVTDSAREMLEDQIAEWEGRLERAIRARIDEEGERSIELILTWRRQARGLIGDAPTSDGAGRIGVMHALTMLGAAHEVEDLAERYRAASERASSGIDVAAWRRARASVIAYIRTAAAAPPAGGAEAFDAYMRDTVGRLHPAAAILCEDPTVPTVWIVEPVADLSALEGEEVPESLRAVIERLGSARSHPLFGPMAEARLGLIERLSRGRRSVAEAAWMEAATRARMDEAAADAIAGIADHRAGSDEVLRELAGLFDLVDAMSALDLSGIHPRRRDGVCGAVNDVLRRSLDPAGGESRRVAGAIARILAVSGAAAEVPDAEGAPWSVRSVRKLLDRACADAADSVMDVLPALASDSSLLHRPDVVSVVARQQDALNDVLLVNGLPTVLAALRAEGTPAGAGAAERLEALTCQLPDEMTRDAALDGIESFVRMRGRLAELPGEAALRRGDPAAASVLGGRGEELLRVIERERAMWLASWAEGSADAARSSRRLEAIEHLGALIDVHARVASRGPGADPGRLGAAEFPAGFALMLNMRVAGLLAEPVSLLFDGRDDLALDAVRHATRETATLRLVDLMAMRMPLDGEARRSAADIVAELSQPPAPGSWLSNQRVRLATVSRWSWEWSQAVRANRLSDADAILAYMNAESMRILDAIE